MRKRKKRKKKTGKKTKHQKTECSIIRINLNLAAGAEFYYSAPWFIVVGL